ncbi:MAG: hypothetical protein KKG59_04350 [Nanoarchaeota archaeon]|nr:hypothetical protein [Nanoarchaeota archaeon]
MVTIDDIAERLFVAKEDKRLGTDEVKFAKRVHTALTRRPDGLRPAEQVLFRMMAGEPDEYLDVHYIQVVADMSHKSIPIHRINVILDNFGPKGNPQYHATVRSFKRLHVQEDPSIGEPGECYTCANEPMELLLLFDPVTKSTFTQGAKCWEEMLLAGVPGPKAPEYERFKSHLKAVDPEIKEVRALAKNLSARERQRLQEFDEFERAIQDPEIVGKAVAQAQTLIKDQRQLDAAYYRLMGKLMQRAEHFADVSILGSRARPRQGFYSILEDVAQESGDEQIRQLVHEQKSALYTPSLGARLLLHAEVMNRRTGGWRNLVGDWAEEIYHERHQGEGPTGNLTRNQFAMYSSIDLFARMEAYQDGQDREVFSDKHRIPYRDIKAIQILFDSGIRKKRVETNQQTIEQYREAGLNLVELLPELAVLAKRGLLSTQVHSRTTMKSDKTWPIFKTTHHTYSDKELVTNYVQKKWGGKVLDPEEVVQQAINLEPGYRLPQIMGRLQSLEQSLVSDGAVSTHLETITNLGQNPYLVLRDQDVRLVKAVHGLTRIPKASAEKVATLATRLSKGAGDLAKEFKGYDYNISGVDITDTEVQASFTKYEQFNGTNVLFYDKGTGSLVRHSFRGLQETSDRTYDARFIHHAVQAMDVAIPMVDVRTPNFKQRCKYISRANPTLLKYAGAGIRLAKVADRIKDADHIDVDALKQINLDYNKILTARDKLDVTIHKHSRGDFVSLLSSGGNARIVTSNANTTEDYAFLGHRGFVGNAENRIKSQVNICGEQFTRLQQDLLDYNAKKEARGEAAIVLRVFKS